MYYFMGIKGAGMSSLAVILKNLGYQVSGSDLGKHFFTESELVKNDIPFYEYNANNIKEGYTIIRGASITDENPEVIRSIELGLKIYDYQEMVGKLTEEFKTICICGCHGKTTTTAMTAHVIGHIKGINYLIGDGTGYASTDNTMFALESCEYRRHFLNYTPYYTVILNIDLDHVDYFKDIDDIISAYQELANKSTKMIVANGDDANVHKMNIVKDICYFGMDQNNDIYPYDIQYLEDGTKFKVRAYGKEYGEYMIPIYAKHQLYDAMAVISVSYLEGLDSKQVGEEFKSFKGARRRFAETVCRNNIVIDDYAHHPAEVKATVDAIRQKYPNKKIIAIFQPHTFTRTKEFAHDLAMVFKTVDYAYIMDIHPARERQEDYPDVTSNLIIDELPNGARITIDDANTLNQYDNAVFIFMSPNDISKLENDLINLKK